ncbi:MAG TPA: sulfatase [Opitutaceae bacterium]|nr:sulfatase [Opitutaceae bacterium]
MNPNLRRLAALAFFVAAAGSALAAAARRPNFVFVYTDDQRYDAMSVVQREQGEKGRFPWFKTPAMDRLAAEGMRFRNAFVTLSLCAPSRAAYLTGRYNHANGVPNNRTPFPVDNVTHATLLRGAGYATAYVGKWHMGGQTGQRPGFDYSASFIGQGRYVDCPFEIDGKLTPTKGWVDDVSTDYAIEFMKQHRDKPFSVVLGFKSCHGPFDPPERAKDRFAGAEARPVPNLGLRPPYRPAAEGTATNKGTALVEGEGGRPKLNLGYFRCVSAADDNLGRVLQALDELGLAEDTVVVFTSDNGYYHGEHSLGDKRSAYEEALRIPLLLRYPRLVAKGKIADEMVLNVDIAPTFLALAGITPPTTMHGRSWQPLLAGTRTEWRKAFFYEYFLEQQFPTTPTLFAVRTERAKLIKYPGHDDWMELFDLQSDPYETKNLAREPAHKALLTEMMATFDREAKAVGFNPAAYVEPPAEAAAEAGAAKKKKKAK